MRITNTKQCSSKYTEFLKKGKKKDIWGNRVNDLKEQEN